MTASGAHPHQIIERASPDQAGAAPVASKLEKSPVDAAQQQFLRSDKEPLAIVDWHDLLRIRFRIPRPTLQRVVPFQLDRAIDTPGCDVDARGFGVVCVQVLRAAHLRVRVAGRDRAIIATTADRAATGWPIGSAWACVRHHGESGYYPLATWHAMPPVDSAAKSLFPGESRQASVSWEPDAINHATGEPANAQGKGGVQTAIVRGQVRPRSESRRDNASSRFAWRVDDVAEAQPDRVPSQGFALFTKHLRSRSVRRYWHASPATPGWRRVGLTIDEDSLLHGLGDWWRGATLIDAAIAGPIKDVWVGRPHCISGRFCGPK